MKDSSGGKAIKVLPEELIFDSVSFNQPQVQQLQLKNNLSAPVEITLKSSNIERMDIEPKLKKLAPFETITVDVIVKITKQLQVKTQKHKETIFIKSDFFDQKINVTLIPNTSATTPRDLSLQASQRISRNAQPSMKRDDSTSMKRDHSPFDIEKELEIKNNLLQDLNSQLQKQQNETSNAYTMLKEEQLRRRELEERLDNLGQNAGNQNEEYIKQVRQLLREREPNLEQLMDLTLKKEKESQERKDAKVLEILKIKDKQIEDLQQRCVNQESEYGKLAQMFQEMKRKVKSLEEQEDYFKNNQMSFEQQLEQSKYRLQQFEKGKEYQRMIEAEERLKESNDYIIKMQSEIDSLQVKIEEKTQIEKYCEEAFERYKEQLQEKENQMVLIMREMENEKEKRIREEEHSRQLMQQINSIQLEKIDDKSQNKMNNDLLNRINRLQDEKNDLMGHIESLKLEERDQSDKLRLLYQRLLSIRGSNEFGLGFSQNQSPGKEIIKSIERKVEDIARLIKELESDNIESNNKNKKLSEILAEREQELQQVIEENEDMHRDFKKSSKKIGKSVQTAIESEDMDVFEQIRDKCMELEDRNEDFKKQLSDYERKYRYMQSELENRNSEIQLITKGHHMNKGSITASSDLSQTPIAYQDQQEELISRLNAKITQLKLNEEKLLDELNNQRIQSQSFDVSQSNAKPNAYNSSNNIATEERIGEYEIILLEQREQLIRLEQENSHLRNKVQDLANQQTTQQENLKLRVKNLQEINQKYEQMNNLTASHQSESMYAYSQLSAKSTQVETERMRQFAQQIELQNMGLKHQNDELKTINSQYQTELSNLKEEKGSLESQIIKMKQDMRLSRVGLGMEQSDRKMAQKLIEQRDKIKYLQGLLIRAKHDFDILRKNSGNSPNVSTNGTWQVQRVEELAKINERLKNEHQQAVMVVVDLKEEYSSKIMILSEKNESLRQKLIKENNGLNRKLEQLQQQLSYMEKKELRLYSQLEEAKMLQSQENQEKESRTKELEELLFKKEETINELEREIKIKDKTLQERQEQISVLINTLENEHSQDQLKQKLLNISAELCSVKAIESQQVKKINEMTHQLKKAELSSIKNQKAIDQERIKTKEIMEHLKKIESENNELEKNIQDLTMMVEDKDRELSDYKYKTEKEAFQLQLKEETIQQLRDQQRRSELLFKEEVDNIRKQFYSQVSKDFDSLQTYDQTKTIQLKTAIQQLHLVISDYLSGNGISEEKGVIQEFEKTLIIASQTIEKLQTELDKSKYMQTKMSVELKDVALSKILLTRQEQLQIQLQKMQIGTVQREQERAEYMRKQEDTYWKVMKDQDTRISFLEKQYQDLESDFTKIKSENSTLKDQNYDLENSLMQFEQEIENKKQAIEKRAELTVDERFKSKNEIIKTYFDSNITRILLNTQNTQNDKIIELGREILSLKLLSQKLESQIVAEQSESQSLEINLSYYKELNTQQETKVRELQLRALQLTAKLQSQEIRNKMMLEHKKQEITTLEKELIKSKEIAEQKTREYIMMNEQISSRTDIDKKQTTNFTGKEQQQKLEEQVALKEQQLKQNQQTIEQLQQKLLDIRTSHIAELDDLRTNYDIEISQARRHLQKEKEQLEKRFMPGYAPGDLMEENQELHRRIDEMKKTMERIIQENAIVRTKLENEKVNNGSIRGEIDGYRQAFLELESTMIEMSQQQQQHIVQQSQITRERSNSKTKKEEKKGQTKKGIKSYKKSQLHFNKDVYPEESQSKIGVPNEQSSLNVSAITSVNMIGSSQRPSTSMAGYSTSNFNNQSSSNNNQKQFIINPPSIVKTLLQSKINEQQMKKKCEELYQNLMQVRQDIKEQKVRELERIDQNDSNQYQQRLIELQIENEDLKIKKINEHIDLLKDNITARNFEKNGQDYPSYDYGLLIEAIISLVTHISNLELNQSDASSYPSIEDAQKLVISSLTQKILNEKGLVDNIQYMPSEQQDRKIWYLELLEQQVNNSESVINQLQNFIKKLSIDIQGNLQSAAQIKAASMDLAQNTKKTSEEVKSLRHIVGLIKHDLHKNMKPTSQSQEQRNLPPTQTIGQKTINPFSETNRNQQMLYDQLAQNTDSLQNQLTITKKVKDTLEQEIVNLKIAQSQELQQLTQKLTQALDQRNSLLQTNEELHDRVQGLQQTLDKLRSEIEHLQHENTQNHSLILEKEKEKQMIAQNKNATGKHLQKLQDDMKEWRRQTDENMKIKENMINDLQTQVSVLQSERDRLKSENQMLRRVEKDRKQNENSDLKKLEQEKRDIMDKLEKEINERKREIEFWVTERATMRQMIEQLENEKVENNIIDVGTNLETQIKTLKKKNHKKIKEKDLEIKAKDKQLQELQDQLHILKQSATKLEQRLREQSQKELDAEERVKYFRQKLQETELERDLVLAEKNNAISSNDVSAIQIQSELNSLRECFAKLKIERDYLLEDIEQQQFRETEWKQQVDSLNEEMTQMRSQLNLKENDLKENARVLEQKNQALLQDVKYLRGENERLKSKSKEFDEQVLKYEQRIHENDIKNQELTFRIDEQNRKGAEWKSEIARREERVKEIQDQVLIIEAQKMKDIENLMKKLDEVKEANAQLAALYENQLLELKNRFINDKKKTEQQVDQMFSIAQREAVIKNLKKEFTTVKQQLTKCKNKNKELKNMLQNQENNNNQNANKPSNYRKLTASRSQLKNESVIDTNTDIYKLAQILLSDDGNSNLLNQLQKANQQMTKLIETQSELDKYQSLNMITSQQLQETHNTNQELQKQIELLQKMQLKESKLQKQSQINTEISKQQKSEMKQLQQEIEQMKLEWLSPENNKQLQERINDYLAQIKSLKEEVQRKKDVIEKTKLAKEETEREAKELVQDMEGLKDDNQKLQKMIKENNKNMNLAKDLKIQNDYLKMQEKRLKDELIQLNERLRQIKLDITRKDQIIKEYKDKLDYIQEEINMSKDKQSEIEKLKDLNKKLKLDSDIKDNQVKSLKVKLDHTEQELDNYRSQSQSNIQNTSQLQQNLESQVKLKQVKIKKYEGYLKKALESLRKIGKELNVQSSKMKRYGSQVSVIGGEHQPMKLSEFDKDMYKDSVNILGMSMDELEDFMNPSVSVEKSKEEINFIAKLDKAVEIPETLNADLEQICNYCVRLINDLNPDVKFN